MLNKKWPIKWQKNDKKMTKKCQKNVKKTPKSHLVENRNVKIPTSQLKNTLFYVILQKKIFKSGTEWNTLSEKGCCSGVNNASANKACFGNMKKIFPPINQFFITSLKKGALPRKCFRASKQSSLWGSASVFFSSLFRCSFTAIKLFLYLML